jgi:hypothetical protein
MINVVFDLDGVLLDSLEVIRTCYSLAGVRAGWLVQAPPNLFALEGQPWLEAQCGPTRAVEIKRYKDEYYADSIRKGLVPTNGDAWVAVNNLKSLHNDVRLHLFTGAAYSAIHALHTEFFRPGKWPFTSAIGKLTLAKKVEMMHAFRDPCIYIDDQPHARCVAHPHITVIHFIGQGNLYSEITRCLRNFVSVPSLDASLR